MYLKVNGKRIRELRKKRGWTQEELGSKEMNAKGLKQISTRTIQKIENDHTFLCSKKMIKNIANVLVIDVNELINGMKSRGFVSWNHLCDSVERRVTRVAFMRRP